ncbi:MAG: polysaccharide deacetylase family protein [Gammaproteobacteria bacterium]|nr:polysaccharide deacetylase family protein [Gammaproteobacteria bacterium]
MSRFLRFFYCLLLMLFSHSVFANNVRIPILCYHNLNPTVPGSMNLTPKKFAAQIKWLKDNGFNIISLKEAVDYLQGKRATLPAKSVVITADDGWKSAYQYMYPMVRQYHIPVTLFIYPETISQGKNAMTWDELKELQQTGLFDIEGHTYWHPNFKKEKRKLSAMAYEKFVKKQLVDSKLVLEKKLGTEINFLAWPFGIYDHYLEEAAAKAGYVMAFTIDHRTAKRSDRPMAQPRFMIVEPQTTRSFAEIVNQAS